MKKIIFGLCTVILFLVPQISQGGYDKIIISDAATKANAATTDWDISDTLYEVTSYVLGFLAALAILVIVISGILYITASGDQERIDTAKQWLLYAIIGLVIALLAFVIVYAVGQGVGVTT